MKMKSKDVRLDMKAIRSAEDRIYDIVNEMKVPDVLAALGNVFVNIAVSISMDVDEEDVMDLFDEYLDNLNDSIIEAVRETNDEMNDDKKLN